MTQTTTTATARHTCPTCGQRPTVDHKGCPRCGTSLVPETYTEKRSRIAAEADTHRKRGSKLAHKLLALHLAMEDAVRPVDRKTAAARLGGACDVLAALHGWTETAWHLAVLDSYRSLAMVRPVLNHNLGGNLAYLSWEAEVVEAIDAQLAKLVQA